MAEQSHRPVDSKPRRSRFRRVLRWFVGTIAVVCCIAGFTLWLITRSWFIVWRVSPELSRKLGGEVTIEQAQYNGQGRFTFKNVSLQTPGLTGPAAQVAHIGEARVAVDFAKLITGDTAVTNLEFDDVTLRMSEEASSETSITNWSLLDPHWGQSKKSQRTPPPRVEIADATLEFGWHSPDEPKFNLTARRIVAGAFLPDTNEDGLFHFKLAEIDEHGQPLEADGIRIQGSWNFATNEIQSSLNGLRLDDGLKSMCPRFVQVWWDRMRLEGQVDSLTMHAKPATDASIDETGQAVLAKPPAFFVQFALKDAAMTLPIDTENLWARYHEGTIEPTDSRQRMHVNQGTIFVGTDRVQLQDISGHLTSEAGAHIAALPFKLSLSIPWLPPIDWDQREQWLDDLLKTVAFDLKFQMNEFHLEPSATGEIPAVELPRIVAKVLAKFQVSTCMLSGQVSMSRGAPEVDHFGRPVAAKPKTDGQVYIHKASGQYQKFPYRLDDVDAYLQFDNDKVTVHSLTGKGSGEGRVRIWGEIAPPDNDASVNLNVTGTNMPVDDRLRQALAMTGRGELEAFDSAFPIAMHESLSASGLLPDAESIESARQSRIAAATRLDALNQHIKAAEASDGSSATDLRAERATIERELARLDRHINAGTFQLGGTVDINLKVRRPLGRRQSTTTTGTITLKNIGFLFDRFPYPLRITGGVLDWQEDRIVLAGPSPTGRFAGAHQSAGLPFIAPGGGLGWVSGEVALPKIDGQRKIRPNLTLTVEDDLANDAVYAAIPQTNEELQAGAPQDTTPPELRWPGGACSKPAQIVRGLGLHGLFNYHGSITVDENNRIDWTFNVRAQHASASPTPQLAHALGAQGRIWPADFSVANLGGNVEVARRGVQWRDLAGNYRGQAVTSHGVISFGQASDDHVEIHVAGLPLDRYVLNLAPPNHAATVAELWTRYQPQGEFDATIEYHKSAQDGSSTSASVTPRRVDLLVGARRFVLACESGSLRLNAPGDRPPSHTRMPIELHDLALEIADAQGQAQGTAVLEGAFDPAGNAGLDLHGSLLNAAFESPLTYELVRMFASGSQAEAFRALEAAGSYDAEFRAASPALDSQPPASSPQPAYFVSIRPQSLSMKLRGTQVHAQFNQGQVNYSSGGGNASGPHNGPGSGGDSENENGPRHGLIELDYIRGTTHAGSFEVSGTLSAQAPLAADLRLDYAGKIEHDQFWAFVPHTVRTAIRAIEFKDGSLTTLENAHLQLLEIPRDNQPSEWRTNFTGTVNTFGSSFNTGVSVAEVDGAFDIALHRDPAGDTPMSLEINARLDHCRALGQFISNIEAPIRLSDDGQSLLVPMLRGTAGDGAIAVEAAVGIGENTNYQAAIDLIGVPLAGFRNLHGESATDPVEAAIAMEGPRGELYANMMLSGQRGQPATRRGRAAARVVRGDIASVPIAFQVLQVLQLSIPTRATLNSATADALIDGDRVLFERILFESTTGRNATIQLTGSGEMHFETLDLNLRFRSRGGLAVLREIVGGLYEIEITGPIWQPQARLVPLPG